MPYFWLPSETIADIEQPFQLSVSDTAQLLTAAGYHPYDTRQAAYEARRNLSDPHSSLQALQVLFVATDTELKHWHRREAARAYTSTYIPVPWRAAPATVHHYAHLSSQRLGYVAYTPDDEHGVQDRQLVTTPGRYLGKYFPELTHHDIAHYVSLCAADCSTLKFATSLEDIRVIYRDGPLRSCMSPGPYLRNGVHPCDVYADSDLAVAYLGDLAQPDSILARAVVWPAQRCYVRCYGDIAAIQTLLSRAGYTCGDFSGARICRLPYSIGYGHYLLMPYLDGECNTVSLSRDGTHWLILSDDGPIACDIQCGYISENPDAQLEECSSCGEQYDPDTEGENRWCEACVNESWTCDDCGSRQSGSIDCHLVEDTAYCDDCYDNMHTDCADDSCESRWIESESFSFADRAARKAHGTQDLCRSCAERYVYCPHCETSYDTADTLQPFVCPDCSMPARCDRTLDLLSMVVLADTLLGGETHESRHPF